MFKQRDCVIDIAALPFANHKIHWITIGIYYGMDFCTGSTPAVSDFV